jgi:hypothetical protein
MTYTSHYPPAHNDTYVKATTKFDTNYWHYFSTDPAKSLTGTFTGNQWLSASGSVTNQRFHIDLGASYVIRRVYYENSHDSGGAVEVTSGVKNFTMQGSNDATAFSTLTFATDTNWTALTTSASSFDKHTTLDQADPKYFTVTNIVAYRYYAFKFSDNWGRAVYMGVRRIVLQTEDGGQVIWFS